MMRRSEKNLLIATRDHLKCQCGYKDGECEVEHDDMAPAVAGTTFISVTPGGWLKGPRHSTNGGVNDLIYNVDVTVIKRITHIARDRRKNVYLENVTGIADELDKIFEAIDFSYDLINAASKLILEDTSSTEGFCEPLKFISCERKPRIVSAAMFAGANEEAAAMARTISFGGARRVTTRS